LNRQEFRRILNREADRSRRYSSPLSLIPINFNRFNLINTEHGLQAGDRLLIEASRLIETEIRTSDNLARWSGEEFIILTPEKLRGALQLAEKLRASILNTSFTGLPPVSASFGVASYRAGEKLESLLQRVDIALYKAKKHQGNRVAFQE
jgi:diguanylate cyclase (GGDEF)-like protein